MKSKRRSAGVLLAFCLLLTACQPTPEEEIVTNKGDGVMEEKIFASPVPLDKKDEPSQESEKITHWTESFYVNDNLIVEIDCDVDYGTGAPYYVEQCEQKEVTPEMVVEIGNTFYGDITGLREQETSYDELLTSLMELERGYFDGWDENGNPIWSPHDKKTKQERSTEIKAQMENTPVESTYVPFETENIHLEMKGTNTLTVLRQNGEESWVLVFISPTTSDIACYKWKTGGLWLEGVLLQDRMFEGAVNELPEPKITEEEAKKMADEFLASIGLENTDCSYASKASWGTVSEKWSAGWCLLYAPALQGTRGVNLLNRQKNTLFRLNDIAEYSQSYIPESIELYVTENGIEKFEWQFIYAINEVVNTSVEILPFEEIQESVRKYFHLAFAWAEETSSTGTEKFLVKDAILTSTFVQVKDDTEHAYRVPTWAIFYIGDDEERMLCWESVMLINAIDGTLIYK